MATKKLLSFLTPSKKNKEQDEEIENPILKPIKGFFIEVALLTQFTGRFFK